MILPLSDTCLPAFCKVNSVPFRVHGEQQVELLFSEIRHRLIYQFDARVGDGNINLAVEIEPGLEQPPDIGGLGYVALNGDGLPARRLDRLDNRRGAPGVVRRVDDHRRTQPPVSLGNGPSQAAGRPGNERDLTP